MGHRCWDWIRLKDVCTKIGSGATPRGGKKTYTQDGPIALIRSQNVYNNFFNREGLAFISNKQADDLANVEVYENDILLNITGDSVARVCQVADDVLPARVNQHVAIIRPDSNVLNPCFLRYSLVSSEMQTKLLSWAGSGGTRNALTKRMVESFEVFAPVDVKEQRAIAHILGTLDDKIELNRRMIETLEAMARALFKSWFVDFDPVRAKMAGRDTGLPPEIAALFPDRLVASELGEIPEGWGASTLGEHVDIFDSKRIPLSRAEREKRQGIYPYHGAAGVMDHVNDFLFDGIYLLIGEDGSVSDERGLAIKQYAWGKFWVNNHAHVLQGKSPVSTEQVYLHLHFEPVLPFVTGAVQPKLSQGRMKKIPFLYPDATICAAFDRFLAPLFEKVRACSMEAQSLASLRDTILPKLMSGKLRLRDADSFLERAL